MTDIDETMPEGRWEFDADVTGVFDDMIARSIPQHEEMRFTTSDLVTKVLRNGGHVVDLGCSRGGAIADLVDLRPDAIYTGVEVSDPMLEAARSRFADNPRVRIMKGDLREAFTDGGVLSLATADVVLCVLTLQFTPIEYRQSILDGVHKMLAQRDRPGHLILVEKVLGATGGLDSLFREAYYDMKRRNGYSDEAIERKRLSLEGALVPLSARWNELALRDAGFSAVDCYWRCWNFAAWICTW